MGPEQLAERYRDRLEDVAARLRLHAASEPPPGLTDPDDPGGERWEWGQVWAHMAEFVPYWTSQLGLIVESSTGRPVPFGRVQTDPGRIAAIESDRSVPHQALMGRLEGAIGELKEFITALSAEDWKRQGLHQTLGVIPMPRVVEQFVLEHLEEHVEQLDLLKGRGLG
jgi:hypothetical protein